MDQTFIDSYSCYDSYKDSGVDWLGEIPEEWNLTPAFKFINENKLKNKGLTVDTVLSLSYGNILIKPKEKLTGLVPESFETYQIVEPNDIIIRCMDLQNDKTSLRIGLVKDKGIITSAYLALKVANSYLPEYLYYYLHSLDTSKAIYKMGTGLRQNLSFGDFKRFQVPNIPLKVQQSIVDFVKTKSAQIDQAITLKQQQITKLEEYKQIIIQNAVTKGLNPDVPMKDSGVDRVSKLPEHWEVKKFRFSFKFQRGLNITKDNLRDEGVLCLNYGEIHSKYGFELLPEHTLKYVDEKYIETNSKSLLDDGDFVFADTSEDTEGSGNFSYVNGQMHVFAGYHTLIAKPIISFDSRFIAYLLDSRAFRGQVRQKVKGVKVYSITQSILKGTYIWLPPREEQKEIVEKLDSEISLLNQTIQSYKTQIDRLKEYKTILINQTVTGKIKVS